ncbi:beta strand repeat-containing protein [Leeuwenhoekiella sp. A16]|uniref:beta strand repeat-containing protein n=1 Tax=unclassified Leeuwenhoekiella TaxID=2615029 RepID=UPI003A813AFF
MKKTLLLSFFFFCCALAGFSQTPGISYQAVILNPEADSGSQNDLFSDKEITIRFTIINDQSTAEYKEYHETATDAYGMINLYIGQGIQISSTDFEDINWNGLSKKVKVEIDFTGSNSNFKPLSEQELTYIPQPEATDYSQIIWDNADAIDSEITRATTAESELESSLLIEMNTREDADALKEDTSNKSTDLILDAASDIKYPSVRSVKKYVDENSALTLAGLNLKVDKEIGKGLSTEDYSTAEKTKLAAISGTNSGDQDLSNYATNTNLDLKANIASPTFTGIVSGITKTMVGLGNADNTSDADKPISTATQTAIDLKVDKVTGKGLSTEDYSTAEKTKLAAISGTNTGDQDLSSYATKTNLDLKADIASPTFTGTVSGITKTMVGLGNVDNTSDNDKPVSTATQTAIDLKVDKVTGKGLSTEDYSTAEKTKLAAISGTNTGDQDLSSYVTNTNLALKADIASPTFTGTVSGITKAMVGLANADNTSDADKPVSTATQTALDLKVDKVTGKGLSTEDYSTAEKTKLAAISGTNTGDQDLSSYATNTNLALKADLASPTFTGTVSGITKTMVGLGNADNTSDADKPISTATQTAIDLKVDKVTGKGLSTEDYSTAEKTKLGAISGTNTGDQDLSSYATKTNLALKADLASPTFTGTVSGITKTMVGLGNVDNTSDNDKPVSTATQTAIDLKVDKVTGKGLSTEDYSTAEKTKLAAISGTNTGDQDLSSYATNTNLALKANIASPTFTGTVSGITKGMVGLGNVDNTSDADKPVSTATQTAIDLKVDKVTGKGLSTEDYSTAEKTKLAAISGTNTGDQDLSSYATNTNLALKADIASPTFTGTVSGITKTMVGLGNADNTSDADKPVSTATQTAIDLKANLASPTLTGTPLAPTAASGTKTTQIATTAFVDNAVSTATSGTFVDLTTNQTIAGGKTFSNDITVNSIRIGRGIGNNGENTAVGSSALGSGTGSRNSAFGNGAMRSYTGTGFDNNTSVGYNNLPGLTTGSGNTSVGAESMMALITGTSNTSIGNQSLINTTGSGNVGVGKSSGSTISSGSGNTIIGTGANVSTNDQNNSTAIGYQAISPASNTIQLGNSAITLVNTKGAITSGGTVTATSFVKSGGTSTEYLMADGSISSGATPVREVADEFSATASQTTFTLTQTPSVNSKVKMYVNGIRISNSAYSVSAKTLTYVPANNGNYTLSESDRIQFDFYY